jgi:hypothetical protein
MNIQAFSFQPFESRQGHDTVIGLRFEYDPGVNDILKAAVRVARETLGGHHLGGWQPEHEVWYVERCAWPIVRQRLVDAGHVITGQPGDEAPQPPQPRPEAAALPAAAHTQKDGEPMSIRAIETSYKGYRFRSRLEARWAVFFTALGLPWHYEHQGFDIDGVPYLPDFWLPLQRCWVEIKPRELETEGDWGLCRGLAALTGDCVAMLGGCLSPFHHEPDPTEQGMGTFWGSYRGWFPCGFPSGYPENLKPGEVNWCDGCCNWGECPFCHLIGFGHFGDHDLCKCVCSGQFIPAPRKGDWGRCARCGASDYGKKENHKPHPPAKQEGSPRILAAYRAARAARFEHGETPTVSSPPAVPAPTPTAPAPPERERPPAVQGEERLTPAALLDMLHAAGVELFVEDGRLRRRCKRRAYTPGLQALVAPHKQDLCDLIRQRDDRVRREALARAAGRCEWQMEDDRKRWDTVRCECTAALQVYHGKYPSLGREALADVRVLCDWHHQLQTVLDYPCRREPLCIAGMGMFAYDVDEAESWLREQRGHSPDTPLKELLKNAYPGICPTCSGYIERQAND